MGRLREPLDAAAAADALLVSGIGEDASSIAARLAVTPVFRVIPRYDQPRLIDPFGAALPASVGRCTVAVAGIARPGRFFAAVREERWDVARELVFRDHHWFTSRDLESIRRAAVDANADVVLTTEKDAVRLDSLVGRTLSGSPGAPDKARPTGDRELVWAFLPLQTDVEPPQAFAAWVNERLAAARRHRVPASEGGEAA